jgi:hypothetical protein
VREVVDWSQLGLSQWIAMVGAIGIGWLLIAGLSFSIRSLAWLPRLTIRMYLAVSCYYGTEGVRFFTELDLWYRQPVRPFWMMVLDFMMGAALWPLFRWMAFAAGRGG